MSPDARRPDSGPTNKTPRFFRVATLDWVEGAANISASIAGATTSGAFDAKTVAVIASSVIPSANLASKLAVDRCDYDALGLRTEGYVVDADFGVAFPEGGGNRVVAQGPESVATDETLSGFGHDDIDAGPEFNQFRDYVRRTYMPRSNLTRRVRHGCLRGV